MCAAHGKKYGSFPLTKLHLSVSKSLLTQEIWVRRGTVFNFFSGKMDHELVVFWSKTEVLGQFCVFFSNDN